MVGLPFDTNNSIIQDFSNAAKLDFDEYAIYPLIPYPGTNIWKYPDKYGYQIVNKNFNDYIQLGTNVSTCFALKHYNKELNYTFDPTDVERWHKIGHEILSKSKNHISISQIAK